MKRVRCPKCDAYITFDETQYSDGQSLVFVCPECNKQFAIRIGVSKFHNRQKETHPEDEMHDAPCGSLLVIENVFHFKQVIPLKMGRNVVGKYMKGNKANCQFETRDPSVDMHHCIITVDRDKQQRLRYTLQDGPSYTGTFVDNEILGDRERRIIEPDTLFTLGATSIILKGAEE